MTSARVRTAFGIALLAALCACTAPADHPTLKDAKLPPLVSAHRFTYHGDVLRGYELSPDGSRLAWIGPYYKRSRLFVRDNATGDVRHYRIRSYAFTWSPDSRRVLY